MIAIDEKVPHPKLDHRQLATRYDALAKVTGRAKYAAEFPVENAAYAYIVQANIPSGSVASIDQGVAAKAAGVYSIITPFNAPKLTVPGNVNILQDTNVLYSGQPIAVVVPRSLLEDEKAAKLLRIEYKEQPAKIDFNALLKDARAPKRGGTSRR